MNTKLMVVAGAEGAVGRALISEALKLTQFRIIGLGRKRSPQKTALYERDHVSYRKLDFSDVDAAQQLNELLCAEAWDEVHWIHAVGNFTSHRTFIEHSLIDLDEIMFANFTTVAMGLHAWLNQAVKARAGQFVAYSSLAVSHALPFLSGFIAAKAAAEALIKTVSNEVLIEDVAANCISLPTIRTDQELRLKPNADVEHWITPEEVARITLSHVLSTARPRPRGAVLPFYRPSITFFGNSVLERYGMNGDDFIQ